MKPDRNINGTSELHGYSDADYVFGDNNTWKSVTAYIIIIDGAVIVCYTICYRSWIFNNYGVMVQNNSCMCDFMVYGSCHWITHNHARWQRWSYTTIG